MSYIKRIAYVCPMDQSARPQEIEVRTDGKNHFAFGSKARPGQLLVAGVGFHVAECPKCGYPHNFDLMYVGDPT